MKLKDLIVFENEDIVAVNKPSGLLSIPDREGKENSLQQILLQQYGTIFTVHRLDRETTGLILFARTTAAHSWYSQQFEKRTANKWYTGIVLGSPEKKSGDIEAPIAENTARKGTMIIHRRGKAAHTGYEVLEDFKRYAYIKFRLYTGRTHQIRVHAKEIGHPLVCDPVYGDGKPLLVSDFKKNFQLSKNELEERPLIARVALHASTLQIPKPDHSLLELEAPLPKDMRAALAQMGKNL